ncbi:MAG: choice-of-anchor R domain-containing protein [Patescibacteria group bacterium]|jgi:hypothetical protein
MARLITQDVTGNTAGIGDISGTEYRQAQSFLLSNNAIITSVEVSFISNYNSPSGQITLRIETDSTGPSNTLVDANATKTFTPTESAYNTITFDTSFMIDKSTLYWIALRCDNQSADNAWRINTSNSGVYSGGQVYRSTDGGSSWSSPGDYDMTFRLNGSLLIPKSQAIIIF